MTLSRDRGGHLQYVAFVQLEVLRLGLHLGDAQPEHWNEAIICPERPL